MKLKDWYNCELVEDLASRFESVFAGFPRDRFVRQACDQLENLEMMDRVRQIARAMQATFPRPTRTAMEGLIRCLGPALPAVGQESASVSSGYALWPFGEYIGMAGLDDWDASWQAMEELTQRLTSEFAVRPFLASDLEHALERLRQRLDHPSHHVRRWVSEATRTRLPWGKGVPALRSAVKARLALLEALKADPSLYVRRSVANHLQDILKDDLEIGLEVVRRWAQHRDPQVAWVVRHACRGLLKAGHPEVLALYGWDQPVQVSSFELSPSSVGKGDEVTLRAVLAAPVSNETSVRLDFSLRGPTPSGGTFCKIFRWTELDLAANETRTLERTFAMVERSTRRLPPGEYGFCLRANGEPSVEQTVLLRA